jgi:tryptophanyl-tRNA synthetase
MPGGDPALTAAMAASGTTNTSPQPCSRLAAAQQSNRFERVDRVAADGVTRPRSGRSAGDLRWAAMTRVLSGIQPSGELHLGNYLGAIRNWVTDQDIHDCCYCVVDLHALTLDIVPADLRDRTFETALDLLAAGLDPDRCTLFVQSHVVEHTRLTWLLECTATTGELSRMTQFKDKSTGQESVRAGLFTYPVLMAADILLYDADRVPVGDDQRQHLELTRELAGRFNHRYGDVFVVPEAAIPAVGARVMDLQHPDRKMSKSVSSPLGTVLLLDPPEEIDRKIRKAVTDTESEVRYDRATKPGVSNLLELLAVATGRSPEEAAADYGRYGDLKKATAEALVEMLRPVQDRRRELAADPGEVRALLAKGADKATAVASATYARAAGAMGLLPA